MKAAFYAGNSRIELRDVPTPTPGAGEVLIRMAASVICGSELHDYHSEHGSKGIAGHEGVGAVVSAPATSGLTEGQLVAIQVLSGCGNCEQCLSGDPEHCAPHALPRRHPRRIHGRARHVLPSCARLISRPTSPCCWAAMPSARPIMR